MQSMSTQRKPTTIIEFPGAVRKQQDRPQRTGSQQANSQDAMVHVDQQFGPANSTADRAIDLLMLFSDEKPVWSAVEIASRLNMPRSTTYRYLNSLRASALIIEDGQGYFHLGPRLFRLARAAKSQMSIVTLSLPRLESLAQEFGEMVVTQQRVGMEIISLRRAAPMQRVVLKSSKSHLLPWPATASAKALLAFASQPEREEIIPALSPWAYTTKTLPDMDSLLLDLECIRQRGYAITNEERDEGVWGAAAPVFERELAPYCISFAAPVFRVTAEKRSKILHALVRAAAALTEELRAESN
jgi:DNA-binding IclR family transcriptional regulator